jgi:hypothetical protein
VQRCVAATRQSTITDADPSRARSFAAQNSTSSAKNWGLTCPPLMTTADASTPADNDAYRIFPFVAIMRQAKLSPWRCAAAALATHRRVRGEDVCRPHILLPNTSVSIRS